MTTEWFRNTDWTDAIEDAFDARLRRARRKEAYLRIQACTLAPTHPNVALKLLERYFALPDDFDHAQAHVDRATAYLSLGRVKDAIGAYEAALRREAEFPKLTTDARFALPFLIATRGVREEYQRALGVLVNHGSAPRLSVDRFRWRAARALIGADFEEREVATAHATLALEAASEQQSVVRYHSAVGLVTERYEGVIGKLVALSAAIAGETSDGATARGTDG